MGMNDHEMMKGLNYVCNLFKCWTGWKIDIVVGNQKVDSHPKHSNLIINKGNFVFLSMMEAKPKELKSDREKAVSINLPWAILLKERWQGIQQRC